MRQIEFFFRQRIFKLAFLESTYHAMHFGGLWFGEEKYTNIKYFGLRDKLLLSVIKYH